jgi:hypothetical protein
MFALNSRRYLLIVVLAVLIVGPTFASAAGMVAIVPPDCNNKGGCQSVCDIAQLAQNVLNDAIIIAVFLAAILFAYAGLKMLMAPANAAQYSSGKKLFLNVLIGFLIILGSWLIVNTLMSILFAGHGGLPWNKIC